MKSEDNNIYIFKIILGFSVSNTIFQKWLYIRIILCSTPFHLSILVLFKYIRGFWQYFNWYLTRISYFFVDVFVYMRSHHRCSMILKRSNFFRKGKYKRLQWFTCLSKWTLLRCTKLWKNPPNQFISNVGSVHSECVNQHLSYKEVLANNWKLETKYFSDWLLMAA